MAMPTESKSIVSLVEFYDDSFNDALGQISACPGNIWNEKMCVSLESAETDIIEDLEYYIESLKSEQLKTDKSEWPQLSSMVLSHLHIIRLKLFEQVISFNSAIARLLEEILAIYGTLQLNTVALLYKDNDSDHTENNQLSKHSKQIFNKLRITFHWTELNVLHCLLKIKFDRKSPSCVYVMKTMYEQVLFTNKIPCCDDQTFCAYYLLFCKYKRFVSSSEHGKMLERLLYRFDKDSGYLENSDVFNNILHVDSDSHTANGRVKVVNNYFKYIKDREKLDTLQITATLDDTRETTEVPDSHTINNNKSAESLASEFHESYEIEDRTYSSANEERIITFSHSPRPEDTNDDDQEESRVEAESVEVKVENDDENEVNADNEHTKDEKKIYFLATSDEIPDNNTTEMTSYVGKACIDTAEETVEEQPESIPADEGRQSKCDDSEITSHVIDDFAADVKCEIQTESNDVSENMLRPGDDGGIVVHDDMVEKIIFDNDNTHDVQEEVYEETIDSFEDITDTTNVNCKSEKIDTLEDDIMDNSKKNLITQLQEYLTISKGGSSSTDLIVTGEGNVEEEVIMDETEMYVETSPPEASDEAVSYGPQTEANEYVQIPEIPESENVYQREKHDPVELKRSASVCEEQSNYIYEFGYETPPKDGTIEQEFSMVQTQVLVEPDCISQNGFLTPENEPVCMLLPEQYNSKIQFDERCLDYSIKAEDLRVNSGTYEDNQGFYPVAALLPDIPMSRGDDCNDPYGETSLDLRISSRRNSAVTARSEELDVDERKINNRRGNGVKCKNAITFNGNVGVQKYRCDEMLIQMLNMPTTEDIFLKAHQNLNTPPIPPKTKKSRKQLIASFDMDIDQAFATLNRKPLYSQSKKKTKGVLQPATAKNVSLTTDPGLIKLKQIADLTSINFDANRNKQRSSSSQQLQECAPLRVDEIKTEVSDESDADILKDIHKNNYTAEELMLLVQAVKTDTETRLPFKKRRMTVPEEGEAEISYPATPMVSIAELETMQASPALIPLPSPHNGRTYLSEMPLQPAPVGVEVNYNLNPTYPYNFVPCAPAYFAVNAEPSVQYCYDRYDMKENLDLNRHYLRTESVEP